MKLIILAAIQAFIIMIIPFSIMWSLNTLFPALNIEYSVLNWIATYILFSLLMSSRKKSNEQ